MNTERNQHILQRAAARARPQKFSAERKVAAQKIVDSIIAMDGHAEWKIFAKDDAEKIPALALGIAEYDPTYLLWGREKGWEILNGQHRENIELLFNPVTHEFEATDDLPGEERTDVTELLLARTVAAFERRHLKTK